MRPDRSTARPIPRRVGRGFGFSVGVAALAGGGTRRDRPVATRDSTAGRPVAASTAGGRCGRTGGHARRGKRGRRPRRRTFGPQVATDAQPVARVVANALRSRGAKRRDGRSKHPPGVLFPAHRGRAATASRGRPGGRPTAFVVAGAGRTYLSSNVARPSWPCCFTGWKPVPHDLKTGTWPRRIATRSVSEDRNVPSLALRIATIFPRSRLGL